MYRFPTVVSSQRAVSFVITRSVITEISSLVSVTSPSLFTAFTDISYVFAASRSVSVYVVSVTSS